ncbi:MAG: hypothetical protein RLW62_05535, partial [Gammaproteobacteria bacterium]
AAPSSDATAPLVAAAAAHGVALHVLALPVTGTAAARTGMDAGGVLLVRPDRHLCARWRRPTLPAFEHALARALGVTT